MDEEICPVFDRCFVSGIMRSIEIPYLLRYCQQSYANCRYFTSLVRQGYMDKPVEEAPVV